MHASRNADLIHSVTDGEVVNLSATLGPLFIDSEVRRKKVCFLSNGSLVVLGTHETDLDVLSYKEIILHESHVIKETFSVGISVLEKLYAVSGNTPSTNVKETYRLKADDQALSSVQTSIIKLIAEAVAREASDMHIIVSEKIGIIAIRVHGDLYKVAEYPASTCMSFCQTIYNSMSDSASETLLQPKVTQDARMSPKFVEQCNLFGARVAVGPTDDGLFMVIRLLHKRGNVIPSLEELGHLPEHIAMISTMRKLPNGIQIISGPTGSGKSTTLTSVISSIIVDAKGRGKPIIMNGVEEFLGLSVSTIEDPPEYKIDGANQTPLIADRSSEHEKQAGWARGISAMMRRDPDILMVGEMRDHGSARAGVDAAVTGHGVWTTVHTSDATSIMTRLADLGVDKDRLYDPEIVTGLINQSLAQRLCQHCSIPWDDAIKAGRVEPDLQGRVRDYCETAGVRVKGDGCQHCKYMGITGRIVVAEMILPNLDFMEVFQAKGKAHAKRYWITKMGGITKCMALIRRINQGLIDPDEGERSVMALDRDRVALGVDYSKSGPNTASRALTHPLAGTPGYEPEKDALAAVEVDAALRTKLRLIDEQNAPNSYSKSLVVERAESLHG